MVLIFLFDVSFAGGFTSNYQNQMYKSFFNGYFLSMLHEKFLAQFSVAATVRYRRRIFNPTIIIGTILW